MKYLVTIALVLALILGVGIVSTSEADAAFVFHSGFETSDMTEWGSVIGSPAIMNRVPEHLESYETGQDSDSGKIYVDNWYAQTFTTDSNGGRLCWIEVYAKLVGSDLSATDHIAIWSTSGGVPDTELAWEHVSALEAGYTWGVSTQNSFPDIVLSPTTTYAVVYHEIGFGDEDDHYIWGYDGSSPSYSGGQYFYSSDGGSSWGSGDSGKDFLFKVYYGNPNTGDYAMRCDTTGGASTAYVQQGGSARRQSFYINIATAPSDLMILTGSSVGDNIRLSSSRVLYFYDSSTQRDMGSQLGLSTWYRISFSIASDGNVKVYLDGIEDMAYDTDNGIAVAISVGIRTSRTADIYIDDVAAGNTDSTDDLGDIRVLRSDPVADGYHNDWKNDSDTACTSADCYTDVDEVPAVITDYVWFESNGSINEQTFTSESMTTLGIDGLTPNAISTWYYYETDGGGGVDDYYHIVRDNGTDYQTSVDDPKVPTWISRYDAVMPNGSGAWTEARVDSFEFGMSTDDANKDHWLYTTYKMIAYTAAAAGCSEDISNTPSTWSINGGTPVATSTDYWAKGSAPTFPLDDSECTFTVTNNSGGAVDITIKATNFTGGVGWTLAGTASTDTVVMKAGKSGDALEANMVTLTTSFQSFISSLADSATKKWELMIESATSHTDGVAKSSTVTASATCS